MTSKGAGKMTFVDAPRGHFAAPAKFISLRPQRFFGLRHLRHSAAHAPYP